MGRVEHWWERWQAMTGKPVPDVLKVNNGNTVRKTGKRLNTIARLKRES